MKSSNFLHNIIFLQILFFGFTISCSSEQDTIFWEYCIPIEITDSNDATSLVPPLVGVVLNYEQYSNAPLSDSSAVEHFIISTETPITTIKDSDIDPFYPISARTSLAIVDALSSGQNQKVAARMAFKSINILKTTEPSKFIPSLNTNRTIDGIIGGDILRKFVVRFFFGEDPQCTFAWDTTHRKWANILFLEKAPFSSSEITKDGFAVIDFNLSGGGKYLTIDDKSFDFPSTRIPVRICLEPDPFPPDPTNPDQPPEDHNGRYPISGVDMYALVATGTKHLITTSESLVRIEARLTQENIEPIKDSVVMNMEEGAIPATNLRGASRIAIVGNIDSSLSACAELARRRGKEWGLQHPDSQNPFYKDEKYSGTSVLEIDLSKINSNFTLTAISSQTSYWQGLWLETMPSIPQIDLILGFNFLKYFELFIDYPKSELSARCLNYNCENLTTCCDKNTKACYCSSSSICCQYNLNK